MVLTSMRVVGQPSVLYLRRSHPPSRYQPSRPFSWILASTSSSVYGLGFTPVSTAIASLERSLHHNATVDIDGLTGDERGLGRREPEGGPSDVVRPAPASERRGLGDRPAEVAVRLARKRGLDPARAEHV